MSWFKLCVTQTKILHMTTLSKSLKLAVLLYFISGAPCMRTAKAQLANLPNDYLPPCPDTVNQNMIQYLGQYHQNYGGIVDLQDPIHYDLQNCFPPPASIGDSTTHTFWSTAMATIHVTGGPTFVMNSPALVTVKVLFINETGNVRTFSNEMIQLDISGGNLPAGTMIHQSPVHPSTGITTIEDLGTSYTVSSYFDIWTELSFDTGATWIPADTAGRMTLSPNYFGVSVPEIKEDYTISLSPNPFSNSCNFSFSVLKETKAKLEVFDLNGKLIRTLFDETAQPGKLHKIEFDGSSFPESFYIGKFSAGNKSTYQRMIMIR